jgi:4-amino-4-deoxy-L-arabinose transferase-like glycosyltransferase
MDEIVIVQRKQDAIGRTPLALLAATIFLASLGWFVLGTRDVALIDRDEPMIAEVARQMVVRGEWLTPHLPAWEDKSIFKPPLAMWVMAGSFEVFGISEFAARLPSALSMALTATVLLVVARRRWGTAAGLVAAACMVVPLLPTVVGHMALTDSLLTLLGTIVLLCLDRCLRLGSHRGCQIAIWTLTGAAMLIKGPAVLAFLGPALVLAADRYQWKRFVIFVGGLILLVIAGKMGIGQRHAGGWILAVLGAVVAAWCLARWTLPLLRLPLGAAWGIPLMLATCGWWFLYVSLTSTAHVASAKRFLLFEVLTRIAQPMESHWGPPGYYLAILAIGMVPFTPALIPILGWSRRSGQLDDTQRLLWAWAIGSWVLCEIASTKLPHYILPGVPALALLAGIWWQQAKAMDGPLPRWHAFGLVQAVLWPAAAIGALTCIAWSEDLRIGLVDHLLAPAPALSGRIAFLARLEPWQIRLMLAVVLVLLATAMMAYKRARTAGLRHGLVIQTAGWTLGLFLLVVAGTTTSPFNESLSRQAARRALRMGTPDTRYFAVGYTEPALFFYLPPRQYARVESPRRLEDLNHLDEPFVLISNRKQEPAVREVFAGRIETEEVVSGLNTAKGAPETACVFRIVPMPAKTTN